MDTAKLGYKEQRSQAVPYNQVLLYSIPQCPKPENSEIMLHLQYLQTKLMSKANIIVENLFNYLFLFPLEFP